jgi:hypothetical protein
MQSLLKRFVCCVIYERKVIGHVLWPVQRSSTKRERQGESGILTPMSVAEILWRQLVKHSIIALVEY